MKKKVVKKVVKKSKPIEKIFKAYVSPDWNIVETVYNQKKTILVTCSDYSQEKKDGLVEITIK